ncbi:Abi family protein [Lactiplantibacillus plantarum]|uniref:Abi family protein n=1 Tax=Lactiplantibacillus plantarum TaxID=1590 RepID=UPI0020BF19BD|nr:Abi family protein [Lactiplantibacillus plantarum]
MNILSDKPFKSIGDQLSLLSKKRNLTILDPEIAHLALRRYGYYEIINGYKSPFLVKEGNDDLGYKDDATFEHIYALYSLDREIRETILQGLEQFEQTFKQALAYSIAKNISDLQKRYTAKSHYNKGESHTNHRGNFIGTDRDRLLKKFARLLVSKNQPIYHYSVAHGNVPPWILIKSLSFGETIYWYKLSQKPIREDVISNMFGIDQSIISKIDSTLKIKQAFGDTLSLCLDYRNLTAHGGRVYNHRSIKHALNWSIFIYREGIIHISHRQFLHKQMRSSVGALIKVLSLFENKDPYRNIEVWLSVHLDSYLQKYPMDKTMLEKAMELTFDELPK